MRKLLIIAAILALAVNVWAQVSATTDITHDARVKINIKFAGLSITINAEADPASNGSSQNFTGLAAWTGEWASGTEGGDDLVERRVDDIQPCNCVHQVLWIENTGGLNADGDIWFDYSRTDETAADLDWTLTDHTTGGGGWIDCVGLAADQYKQGVALSASTASAAHVFPPPVGLISVDDLIGHGTGSEITDWIDDLVAEDPSSGMDGTWTAGETDQMDFDIAIVVPPSIGCTDGDPDIHHLYCYVSAEVETGD